MGSLYHAPEYNLLLTERPGWLSLTVCFSIDPQITILVEGIEYLLISNLIKYNSAVTEELLKMPQSIRGQGGDLDLSDRPGRTQTLYRMLNSCFLSSLLKFSSVVAEKKSKMSQPIRGQGGHPGLSIYKNLVENINLLRPVKFH